MFARNSVFAASTSIVLAALVAGCTTPGGPDPEEVTFTATNYAFAGPETIPSGWTRITLVNAGEELHHMQMVRLTDGKTLDDLRSALLAMGEGDHTPPEWVVHMGGPNGIAPGSTQTAIMDLEPGTYVLFCVIPDAAGTPHFAHGMMMPVQVEARAGYGPDEPSSDFSITEDDFAFSILGDATSGERVIRVENEGGQAHEVELIRLHGDATIGDVLAAFGPNATGPPPADFLGGVVGIERGDHAYFEAGLTPGRYGLLCFFTDPASGAPHFALGMMHEFDVG